MRAQPQLYVRNYKYTGTNGVNDDKWVLLDLYASDPLTMTLRVQDVTEPSIAAAQYSQTFRIPNSATNGQFFEQVFNVNQTYFDPSKKCQAYINDEGAFFMNGCIQLMNVYFSEHTQKVEYEITFFGETSDFASQIGINNGGYLSDLGPQLAKYNHAKNLANIQISWSAGPFSGPGVGLAGSGVGNDVKGFGPAKGSTGGDIVYPLIEWGYNYTGSGQATYPVEHTLSIAALNATGGPNSFTNPASPLTLAQMKPALRLKCLFDAIFETTEYTYESEFITGYTTAGVTGAYGKRFSDLYIVTDSTERAAIGATVGFKGRASYVDTASGIYYNFYPVNLDQIIYDLSSNYNQSNHIFTPTIAGSYTFNLTAQYQVQNAPTGSYMDFVNMSLRGGGGTYPVAPSGSPQFLDPYTNNGFLTISAPATLAIGQEFGFYIFKNFPGNLYLYNIQIEMVASPANPQFPFVNMMPPQIKQIDFMRSVIERFKLVFVPSRIISKHFNIVPWDDWIQQGSIRDWSNKVNGNVDFKITPLFQTQPRFITYKDQEDSDYLNYNYQQAWKQPFGYNNQDSQIEVIKDTKTIQGVFAPMPIGPIGYGTGATAAQITAANTFLIPHLAKDQVTENAPGKRTPMQPKLRIAWFNGLVGVGGTGSASTPWYLCNADNCSGYVPINQIPLLSPYYPNPWTATETLDWNIATAPPQWDVTLYGNPDPTNLSLDNFNKYWARWYKLVYGNKPSNDITNSDRNFSMLLDCELVLNYDDIKSLQFNDKIFIKDSYYLVNWIETPFNGQVNSCKAQLFKLNNIGVNVISQYEPVPDLCYSATSLCLAACCNSGNITVTLYVLKDTTIEVGTRLFANASGTSFALAGYYKSGTDVWTVDSNGLITAITAISGAGCTCVPELGSKVLCYKPLTEDYCTSCCCTGEGNTRTVYIADNGSTTWFNSIVFYSNNTGTTYASDGWYSDGTYYVKVQGGINTQSGACNCNCNIYSRFPFGCCYDATQKCKAVCCFADNSQTYYGNNTTLATSTYLYMDQNIAPAPNGWYFDGISAVQVTGGLGAITTVNTPDSCYPCAEEVIPVYFGFTNTGTPVTGTFSLQKSFDLSSWVTIQDFDLATIGTPYNYTGGTNTGTYIRGQFAYTPTSQPNLLTVKNQYDGSTITTSTANPTTFATASTSQPTTNFKYILNISESAYDCALAGGSATKCVAPICIIDTDITVITDVTFCCDPIIVNEGDTLEILGATGTVNGNC